MTTVSSRRSLLCSHSGPKLYKEPSAKSNKHIIQNALAHCCLAGKVNEGQKNKILEVTAWRFYDVVLHTCRGPECPGDSVDDARHIPSTLWIKT